MVLILSAAGLVGLALCHDVLFVWPVQELAPASSGVAGRAGLAGRAARRRSSLPSPAFDRLVAESPTLGPPRRPAGPEPARRPRRRRAADPPIHGRRRPRPAAAAPVPRSPPATVVPPPAAGAAGPAAAVPGPGARGEDPRPGDAPGADPARLGYQVRVVQIDTGPVITQFEIELEAGLRVSKVIGLADDLAIALAVPSVRIVAPIPGKTTVGIEVPNERRAMVKLGEVVEGGRRRGSTSCGSPSSSART